MRSCENPKVFAMARSRTSRSASPKLIHFTRATTRTVKSYSRSSAKTLWAVYITALYSFFSPSTGINYYGIWRGTIIMKFSSTTPRKNRIKTVFGYIDRFMPESIKKNVIVMNVFYRYYLSYVHIDKQYEKATEFLNMLSKRSKGLEFDSVNSEDDARKLYKKFLRYRIKLRRFRLIELK